MKEMVELMWIKMKRKIILGERENVNDEKIDGGQPDDKVEEEQIVHEQQQEDEDRNVPCTTIVLVHNEEEKNYSSTPNCSLGIDFTNPPDFSDVVQVAKSYKENAETEANDDDFVETTPTTVRKKRTKSKAVKGGSDKPVDPVETPKQNSLIKRIKQAPRTRKLTEKAEPKEKADKDKKKKDEIAKKDVVIIEEVDKKGKEVAIEDDEKLSNWKRSKVWKKVKDNEKGLLEEFNQGVKMKIIVWESNLTSDVRGKEVNWLMMNCETDSQIINWWSKHLSSQVLVGAGQVFVLASEL